MATLYRPLLGAPSRSWLMILGDLERLVAQLFPFRIPIAIGLLAGLVVVA